MSAQKICPQCGAEYELDQRFCPKDGSTLKSQNAAGDLVGTIIADRYHVLRRLGEGGMGTVYLAEHVKMGRKSAVKVMNPGMVHDADAISRFNREAANASKISHPNVAAVYDFGETSEGLIYLAMEFVEGPPLTKVIEESGALPPIRAADIARQTADALSVAHEMGIVHRDLKPDNIMLAKNRDGSDCVKVVDFGIAKVANSEAQKVTRTGLVVGTPEYMSPEQLAGDKLDGRSDIYSLGLVAFATMTGKLPFPGETVQESMIARLTDEPKRLIEMKPDVNWPPSVQAVMDKALQRDFETRYKSAAEFGRDLYNAVASMPESAATNAFTAVMNRLSTPQVPPVAVASPPKGTKIVPPTRVNRASSREADPLAEPQRSRTNIPLWVIVGVVAVAGLSVVSVQWFGPGGTAVADTRAGQVDTRPVPAPSLTQILDSIKPMTDIVSGTESSARRALDQLSSIPEPSDTTEQVYLAFLTASAHFRIAAAADEQSDSVTSAYQNKQGCDILKSYEGKAQSTRFKAQVNGYLYGNPDIQLPAAC